jgi:hypothetical protein
MYYKSCPTLRRSTRIQSLAQSIATLVAQDHLRLFKPISLDVRSLLVARRNLGSPKSADDEIKYQVWVEASRMKSRRVVSRPENDSGSRKRCLPVCKRISRRTREPKWGERDELASLDHRQRKPTG